ncbi:hypothetical protein L7F22_047719 [Adiantum nelumboides]|nr:hypothetical protein [Adiantum nelumboides]
MLWSFFALGHGKMEHDGARAVVKRALTHEQLNPDAWHMKCSKDVVGFLEHKFNDESCHTGVNRNFWEVQATEGPREKKWNCKRVESSQSIHYVNGYSKSDKSALHCRHLSCFCEFCMSQCWRRCLNNTHDESLEYLTLEALDGDNAKSEDFSNDEGSDLPMYGGHHDTISDALCIGDTFATNANEDGANFYILRCSEKKQKTTRALSDYWGNILSAGSYLVEGYYYELVKGAKHIYYIPASQPKVFWHHTWLDRLRYPWNP